MCVALNFRRAHWAMVIGAGFSSTVDDREGIALRKLPSRSLSPSLREAAGETASHDTVERHVPMPDNGHTPNGGAVQTRMMTNFVPEARDSAPAMTSREIADLTGKRHDNVRRTIETLADKGVIALPQIEEKPTEGRPTLVYVLSGEQGKRDSYVIVAQLSPEFTARLVDRWQELETAQRPVDPIAVLNDPAAMRGLLLNYAEKQIELQGAIEEMRPQVQALERIAISDGSMCVTDAAKTLQVQPKALFMFLRSHRWIYSRQGSPDIAYQDKLASGLLEHKTTTVSKSDGSEKTVTQVRVTSKGLTRLAREFPPVAIAA